MFRTMLNDLSLYRRLIGIQLRTQWQYKTNLVIDIATYLGVTGLEFMALLLFFIPFPSILGWKVGEVALLSAIISIGFGLTVRGELHSPLFPLPPKRHQVYVCAKCYKNR
jgi:ABC-2 type transport system permease protein